MKTQILTDVDALCLEVRDLTSKQLILEAVIAYRAGAFRSAIMSTWIAVAYDIISKLRELAAQGEPEPKRFVEELDKAIENADLSTMKKIEKDLLQTVNKQQLFSTSEYDELNRLKTDRDRCAHPAFNYKDELYRPTPELVRAHLVHALNHLLIHAPLQGKAAIARFEVDLLGPAYPTTGEGIRKFIRSRYLDSAKDSLVKNLIEGLFAVLFGNERIKFIGKKHLLSLTIKEIANAKVEIYDRITPPFIQKYFENVKADDLLDICVFFTADTRIWDWLSESTRVLICSLLEKSHTQTLRTSNAYAAIVIPELATILLKRFNDLDDFAQMSLINDYPRPEFVDKAIETYSQAGSYANAEYVGRNAIVPLASYFSSQQVTKLLDAVKLNRQISDAQGTTEVLNSLFENTQPLLASTRRDWQDFVDYMTARNSHDPESYYSYPDIRSKLDSAVGGFSVSGSAEVIESV